MRLNLLLLMGEDLRVSRAAIGQGPAMHDPPTSAGVRDGFEIMVFNIHKPPTDVGLHRQG